MLHPEVSHRFSTVCGKQTHSAMLKKDLDGVYGWGKRLEPLVRMSADHQSSTVAREWKHQLSQNITVVFSYDYKKLTL
jgi:hypothetical protein